LKSSGAQLVGHPILCPGVTQVLQVGPSERARVPRRPATANVGAFSLRRVEVQAGGSEGRRGGGVCCGAVGFSSPAAAAMLGAMSTTEKKQRDSKRRRGRGSHGASPNMIAGAASPTLKIKTISTAFKLRPLPGASWINGPQAKRCIIGRGRLRAFRATPPSVVADD
jgi:hypothetical protein